MELSKGQNAALEVEGEGPAAGARLTIEWAPVEGLDVDVCALLLGEDGRVRSDAAEGGGFAQVSDLRLSIAATDEQPLSLFDVPGLTRPPWCSASCGRCGRRAEP